MAGKKKKSGKSTSSTESPPTVVLSGTAVDDSPYDPLGLSGEPSLPFTEYDEDLEGIQVDEEAEFSLPASDSEIEQLHYAQLYHSLSYFASHAISGPPESPYCGKFLIGEHHQEWGNLIADHRRVCILAPRDHGKSFYLDFAYPIWMAWKNPGKCGFIFSATQSQASDILRKIRLEIEENPTLSHLLPEKRKRWNDHAIQLANGHTIYARGFGTRVRGAHPVWIVCDDVLNDETAYSETVRRKQNDYFFNAVSNMLVPGGQLVVIGTPFHSMDLYAEIKSRPAYLYKRFSAIRPDGKPLWPERYSLELLYWKRDADIGPLRFAREFMCEPIADDISLFPSYLFQGAVEQFQLKLGMPRKYWAQLGVQIFMGVDFAISAETQADSTVIWVMGVDPQGNRWIIDIFTGKGMPYRVQKSKLVEYGRRYQPELIFLESNQMQRIFGDELMLDTDLPIKQFHTGVEKHSLEKGLPSLRTLLEGRKIRIPRGDERSVRLTNEWIAQMGSFIFDGGRVQSVGSHDDMPMAMWVCDQAIRAGSSFSASWTAEDVFTEDEQRRIRSGEWRPQLDDLLAEQIVPGVPLPEGETVMAPGNRMIISEQPGDQDPDEDQADEDDDELDDPFTGHPLQPKRRNQQNGKYRPGWMPNEGAPIPGKGW